MSKNNKAVSFEKFSANVQKLFLTEYADVLENKGDSYAFIAGKEPQFQNFSDNIKAELAKESKARKLQAAKERQALDAQKQRNQDAEELKAKTRAFEAQHFVSFGRLPDADDTALFARMRDKQGKLLNENDFEKAGMVMVEDTYTVPPKDERKKMRAAFNSEVPDPEFGVKRDMKGDVYLVGARHDFLRKMATDYSKSLVAAGLTDKQVDAMAKQGVCPLGYNVHHKKPIHGGGKNESKNFVLIRDNLHHDMIHAHLDTQIKGIQAGESRKVRIATPPDNVMFFDTPKNIVTREQSNDNIEKGRATLPQAKEKTVKSDNIDKELASLDNDRLRMLAREITKLKIREFKGNDGKFAHYNHLIGKLNKEYAKRTDGPEIKAHKTKSGEDVYYKKIEGKEPGIVYIHGTHGSMDGAKTAHVEQYCRDNGLSYLALDLPGHKRSVPPEYKDCTVSKWTEAACEVMAAHTKDKQVVLGHSMGGWIALNVAAKMPEKTAGVVGLAAGPDYTQWFSEGLSKQQKNELNKKGGTKVYLPFCPNEGVDFTKAMLVDGMKNLRLTDASKPVQAPVLLLHGDKDKVVSMDKAKLTQKTLKTTSTVETKQVEGAGHGLGRPQDLEHITECVKTMLAKTKSNTQANIVNRIKSDKLR